MRRGFVPLVAFWSLCSLGVAGNDVLAAVRVQLLPLQVFSGEPSAQELRVLLEKVVAVRLQGEEGVEVIYRPDRQAPAEGFTEQKARQEAQGTGAAWVVWGSLTQVGRALSLDLRLLRVEGTEPPLAIGVQAQDKDQLLSSADLEMDKLLSKIVQRPKVAQIKVEGNRRIGADSVLLKVKTRAGDEYSPSRLQADVREIEKMGYFEDVQVNVQDIKEGKAVTFLVKEKPTIREVLITGNDKIDSDKIREVITIQPQSILNYQALKDAVEKIKKLYQEKGFYGAQVSYELKELEAEQKGVVFKIQEGNKFWVRTIRFEGNEHFSDKELKKVMKTQEKDWLHWITDSGVLDQETLRQDVERLADFYLNRGYIRNKVGTPRIDTDADSIHITIPIEEGPVYTVRAIRLEGDLLEGEDVMKGSLGLKEGSPFSREKLRTDMEKLTERYADLGYAYAEVKPLTSIQDGDRTVDVTFKIQQKQKVHIGRIRILGNTRTRDKVIRRELMLAEGDTFSSTALKKSNERLRALKYFEEVNITSSPGARPDVVDLNVEVKEQQTGSFSLGAGYSSVDKLIGVAEIQQSNLFGRGYKVRLRAELGTKRQFYTFTFIDPWFLDTRTSMKTDLYNMDKVYLSFTRSAIGGDVMFTHPLDRFLDKLTGFWGYRAEDVKVTDVDKDAALIFKSQKGRHLTSEVLFGLTYDTRDQTLYPSKGNLSSFATEFAGVGGDNQFVKHIVSSAQYFPLPWDTVFMARGQFGYAYGWGNKELPVYERFFLGGIDSIRGFKPGAVGPRDPATGDIVGGDTEIFFNFEYIFPILKKLELRGVIFYDTGNAFLSGESGLVDVGSFRHTAGAGIRWYSPFGPLRVELGYNLRPEADEKRIEWAFGMGGSF
jgi:outer membrane protein insertion porin family